MMKAEMLKKKKKMNILDMDILNERDGGQKERKGEGEEDLPPPPPLSL